MIHGIDVSNWQSADYDMNGQSFVIIKATEGLSIRNSKLAAQTAHARAARPALHVGFYHFMRPGDPLKQAERFLSVAGERPGDSLWIDWEDPAVSCADKDKCIKEVQKRAAAQKNKVGLYCNGDFWKNRDTTNFAGDGLWIAEYGVPAGKPNIKAPWLIHQYSDTGGIDHNLGNFSSRQALTDWAKPK